MSTPISQRGRPSAHWTAVLCAAGALASSSCRTGEPQPRSGPQTRPETRPETSSETPAAATLRAEPVAEHPPIAEPTPPPEWARHARVESNAGSYVVHVSPRPEELPDNEDFELRVWVASAAAPHEVAREVKLAVDASMPEHGHGMNRTPKIARGEGGEFVVQGMLFHMTGRWELYFDITAGALTERAQVDVTLE